MGLDERIKYAAMKSRHQKVLRPWYKKWWGILIIIMSSLLFILLSAVSFYVVNEANRIRRGEAAQYLIDQQDNYLTAINRISANSYGPIDAPVTIVEFSDFACPYCANSHAGLKKIREKYPNQIRLVYRDYPLHNTSIFLSLSARCAGEQGKFWQMHDVFFENQEKFNVGLEELEIVMPEIATALGIDPVQFKSCLSNQRHFPQIEQDYKDGDFLQIEGTPTWFINNTRITGHIPAEDLEKLILGLIQLKK